MSDCRFGVSPVNYPDPDPEHAYPILLVYSRLQIMIRCYLTACWHGSSGIKSTSVQDPVLYNSMLIQFF